MQSLNLRRNHYIPSQAHLKKCNLLGLHQIDSPLKMPTRKYGILAVRSSFIYEEIYRREFLRDEDEADQSNFGHRRYLLAFN